MTFYNSTLCTIRLTCLVNDGPEGMAAQPITLSFLFYSAGFSILSFLFFFVLIILSVFSINTGYIRTVFKVFYQVSLYSKKEKTEPEQMIMLLGYNSVMAICTTTWFLPPLLQLIHLGDKPIGYTLIGEKNCFEKILDLLTIKQVYFSCYCWRNRYRT